jgi:hypothetical protein
MSEVSIPPATRSIAAVLADVDGTLVTKKKALTPRAIEAIENLILPRAVAAPAVPTAGG